MLTTAPSPGVDPPYQIYGGIYREEAIMLLRRFYVQENEKGESDLDCFRDGTNRLQHPSPS